MSRRAKAIATLPTRSPSSSWVCKTRAESRDVSYATIRHEIRAAVAESSSFWRASKSILRRLPGSSATPRRSDGGASSRSKAAASRGLQLNGEILDNGADWQIVTADNIAVIDTRYLLRLSDGSLAYLQTKGFRHGPAEVMAELARGEEVDPTRYYFRVTLQFETASKLSGMAQPCRSAWEAPCGCPAPSSTTLCRSLKAQACPRDCPLREFSD